MSASRGRLLAATALLCAVTVVWAALPARPGAGARIVLIVAVIAALGSLGQLALAGTTVGSATRIDPLADRLLARLVDALLVPPWAELTAVAALVLEAEHPARPWHTGLLSLALLGYLLAVHLAETEAPAAVLRPQVPLLAAGLALMALAVGAAALPALPTGSVSSVVKIVAAAAAVLAGGLVVPVWIAPRGGR